MKVAYVDSSCLVAIALDEPGARELMVQLSGYQSLVSSTLLEAEFRAALARENVRSRVVNLLSWVRWVFPKRRLTLEVDRILQLCAPKGADLWHLACALYLKEKESLEALSFLTLDRNQRDHARSLGMKSL